MDGIAELEQRIMAALARLDAGLEQRAGMGPGAGSGGSGPSPVIMAELDRLREELDEERMANAQLSERLKVQRDRAERAASDLRAEAERLTRQVDAQALAMQRLVTSTIRMREDLRRLRAGGADRVDAALIDKAMAAELDAGEALRAAETAELADLVAALTPIVQTAEANGEARHHV